MASPLTSTAIASCSASSSTLHFSCKSSSRRLGFDPFTGNGVGCGLRGRKHSHSFHGTLTVGVRASLQEFGGSVDATSHFVSTTLPELAARAEGFLYTIADAAVSTDAAASQAVPQQNRDWLSGLSDTLESVLKVLKQGLESLHVPYSYGFAIILLTVLVKAATLPLSKQQVESSLSMQNLAPKIKAIQQRYAGNQERIQLETARLYKQAGVNPLAGCLPTLATIPVWIGLYRALSNVANEGLLTEGFFWIPSLSGPTTIAARQSGSGISWIFPFVDGAPPLGWNDTLAYLVLPALLIASQYVSMQIMQPPQTDDPNQKNTQVILKFLPLMIGYFSLSVPSGLSLYWLTNNVLSTGQQVWLRKMGGAKVPVAKDGGDIISAGQALRTTSETPVLEKKDRRGERFRQLKKEESSKKKAQRQKVAASAGDSESEGDVSSDDESIDISSAKDSLEEIYSRTQTEGTKSTTSSGKKSKRKRAV